MIEKSKPLLNYPFKQELGTSCNYYIPVGSLYSLEIKT